MPNAAIFFDLWGTLLQLGDGSVELAPGVLDMLRDAGDHRLGVLCNAGRGRTARDVQRALEAVGLVQRFQRELIVAASDLPTPLPDRRAFAVAAALAELPLEDCVFVSRDVRLLPVAAAARMRPVTPETLKLAVARLASTPAAGAVLVPEAGNTATFSDRASVLFAGEVDEDTGPTFALRGRIVTMDEDLGVINEGRIIIRKGKIVSVGPISDPLPAELAQVKQIDTKGTIYPGLIDLHNHFAYNVLPLWVVPRRSDGTPYTNRGQWPRHKEYKPNVTAPLELMAKFSPTAEAIVRYVETKAIIAGTTTGQGIRGKSGVKTTPTMYHGAMRNVEETNDTRLPEARTMVPDLKAGDPEEIKSFRNALKQLGDQGAAYFYHLSEGVDDAARRRYLDLAENSLIQQPLVGIHALGLRRGDLKALAGKNAKVVWSPLSNLLLYGKTLDLTALRESGLLFSIGCDWAPTGSKNLLQELKVARHLARGEGGLTSEDLVRSVTTNAARVVGWDGYLGRLKPEAMADLVVVAEKNGNPYDHLIEATERSVSLVVIHGIPRYGDEELLEELHTDPSHPLEGLKIGGSRKQLHTFTAGSLINHVTLAEARERLETAMGDLPAFRDRVKAFGAELQAMGLTNDVGFTLVLDNEYDEAEESPTSTAPAGLLAAGAEVELPDSIELDGLEVSSPSYWQRIQRQQNLSDDLKQDLRTSYP